MSPMQLRPGINICLTTLVYQGLHGNEVMFITSEAVTVYLNSDRIIHSVYLPVPGLVGLPKKGL